MGKSGFAVGAFGVAGLVAVALATPAAAQDELPERRSGYVAIAPTAFRKLPSATPDGKKFTLVYVKFNKLFGNELKLYGGTLDGKSLRSHVSGLLVVDSKRSRQRLINNLKGNQDSDGKSLSPKKSNIQVFGIGRRTSKGYVLSVNRVHRLGSVEKYYRGLAVRLLDGDAQGRLDLVRKMEHTVKYYPSDREAVAALVLRLQGEARDAERGKLPTLPDGVDAYLRFAKRHSEIAILAGVWKHPDVSAEDKEAAAKMLRDDLNAAIHLGVWYAYPVFKERLGFWKHEGAWVPVGMRVLLESALAEKKRRATLEIGSGQIDRQLLEVAMRKGDVLRGMSKDMVVAARGGFPVTVDRYREKIGDGTLVWERWAMEDGYQIFFVNKVSFHKIKPGQENKK